MEKQTSSFTNVEYTGFDGASNPFKLTAKNADTLIDQPNIIRMREVKCRFYFKDNKIMIIISDLGTFDKVTNDMTFVDNVEVDYDNSLLTSDNLDVLISENAVIMYDNVLLQDEEGTLIADKVYFDTIYIDLQMTCQGYCEMLVLIVISWGYQGVFTNSIFANAVNYVI